MQDSLMCGIDWTGSGVETLSLVCFLIRVFFYTNVFRHCMWTQLSLTHPCSNTFILRGIG